MHLTRAQKEDKQKQQTAAKEKLQEMRPAFQPLPISHPSSLRPSPVPGPSKSRKRKAIIHSPPPPALSEPEPGSSAASRELPTPTLPGLSQTQRRKTDSQSFERVFPPPTPMQSPIVSEDVHTLKELLEVTNNGELLRFLKFNFNIVFIIFTFNVYAGMVNLQKEIKELGERTNNGRY